MTKINFEAKSDRSLLEMTTQAVNDIKEDDLPEIKQHLKSLNGAIGDHEARIIKLEIKRKMEKEMVSNPSNNPGSRLLPDRLAWLAQGWTGAILTIAAIFSIIYALGSVFGLW